MSEVIDLAKFRKVAPTPAVSVTESSDDNDPWGIMGLAEQSAARLAEEIVKMKMALLRDAFLSIKEKGFMSGTPIHLSVNTHGVNLPQWLKARYPDSMALVLENVGYVEEVTDEAVTLCLSFSGSMTSITIPYQAVNMLLIQDHDFGIMGF